MFYDAIMNDMIRIIINKIIKQQNSNTTVQSNRIQNPYNGHMDDLQIQFVSG